MLIKILIFLFVSSIEFINCLECNRFNQTSKHIFGTKTNYNHSIDYYNSSDSLLNLNFIPNTCKLDKIFLVSRHSTRNPSLTRTNAFNQLLPKLKKSLYQALNNDKDMNNCKYYLYYHLTKYVYRYKLEDAALIVPVGNEITSEIGGRFDKKFGHLMKNNKVNLGISNETRTYQTLKAFTNGFKTHLDKTTIEEKCSLHFHNVKFEDENDDDEDEEDEDEIIRKYKKSSTIKNLKKSISNRLGLQKKLKLGEIKSLYQLCAFDLMLYNETFWCNFFTDQEFDTLEFLLDATMFRKLHFNSNQHLKRSAILFRELREFLTNETEKIFLGFSHSEVLKVLITNLRLFEEKIYLTNDFDESYEKSSEREWSAGRIMPFNSQIHFLKYDCINEVSNKTIPKILTLYQENPVRIANCTSYLCPMATFLRFIYPLHRNETDSN